MLFIIVVFLILFGVQETAASSIIKDSSASFLYDSASQLLYTKTGPLIIADTGTYDHELIDCGDTGGAVGLTVTAAATILNATVVRCPGGAFSFNESATLKNSIGYGDGDDITIAAGKTVSGTSNIFGDAAKAGAGTYTNVAGTQWGTNPLFVNAAGGDFRLRPGSPAINAGVDVGLTSDYEGKTVPYPGGLPDIGAYEFYPATGVQPEAPRIGGGPTIPSIGGDP
jgi:hypothetical protein